MFSKCTIEHFAKEFIACICSLKTARTMLGNDLIRGKIICIKPLCAIECHQVTKLQIIDQ